MKLKKAQSKLTMFMFVVGALFVSNSLYAPPKETGEHSRGETESEAHPETGEHSRGETGSGARPESEAQNVTTLQDLAFTPGSRLQSLVFIDGPGFPSADFLRRMDSVKEIGGSYLAGDTRNPPRTGEFDTQTHLLASSEYMKIILGETFQPSSDHELLVFIDRPDSGTDILREIDPPETGNLRKIRENIISRGVIDKCTKDKTYELLISDCSVSPPPVRGYLVVNGADHLGIPNLEGTAKRLFLISFGQNQDLIQTFRVAALIQGLFPSSNPIKRSAFFLRDEGKIKIIFEFMFF